MTTTSSRKSRKKGISTEEQSKPNTGRTSSRSGVCVRSCESSCAMLLLHVCIDLASSGTRESYGGNVTVSGGSGPGGRTGQRQTSGRGRGQSAGKRVRSVGYVCDVIMMYCATEMVSCVIPVNSGEVGREIKISHTVQRWDQLLVRVGPLSL